MRDCLRKQRSSRMLSRDLKGSMSLLLVMSFGVIAGGVTISGGAAAQNTMSFGNIDGDNVTFQAITTGAGFNTANVSGDILFFGVNSNSFGVSARGGASDSRSTTVNTVVERLGSRGITELQATLGGNADFTLVGTPGPATAATRLQGILDFDVTVLEASGRTLDQSVPLSAFSTVIELNAADDFDAATAVGSFRFDLETEALAAGVIDPVTKISWGITITLLAESEASTASQLSFAAFNQLVLTVPEPGAGLLLGAGGSMLLARRRRA